MKYVILLTIIIFSSISWAQKVHDKDAPFKFVTYEIDKKFYRFISNTQKNVLISESCGMPNNKVYGKCDANDALSKVTHKKLQEIDMRGGKNTGDVLCKKYLSGKVVFGLTRFNNPISFCLFKDGTMVSTGTISYFRSSSVP